MLQRRPSWEAPESPMAEHPHTPALMVLEQYPVPTIALADDGVVLFANAAFAEILGCSPDAVTALSYDDIVSALPPEETLFDVARLHADAISSLQHLDGSRFLVKMSKSARMHGADGIAIARFEELLARLARLAER
jgi:PAS domain-containing protein